MNETIAIVDDESDIVELVAVNAEKAHYRIKKLYDAESLFRYLSGETPDLIILDLMLPDMDGFEVCKALKSKDRFAAIPIVMLTARDEETDKIIGLELGADDYVTKPFSPRELLARVKAVLRRNIAPAPSKTIIIDKAFTIDCEKYEVDIKGEKVDLTTTEFRILELLASRRGRVFSRESILQHLWGDEKTVIDRTIDVHIRHLREKLGPMGSLIKNMRGVGYKLDT